MVDVGRERDRLLDELQFLYAQRREVRALVDSLLEDEVLDSPSYTLLMTCLADRVKGAASV
jgi:hypothetical protein